MRQGNTVKVIQVSLPQTGLNCVHTEAGYNETFRRIIKSVALELYKQQEIPLLYREVKTISQDGQKIGHHEVQIANAPTGGHIYSERSSVLAVESAMLVMGLDSSIIEVTNQDERSIDTWKYMLTQNALPLTQVLAQRQGQRYIVQYEEFDNKGTKEFATDPLPSSLEVRQRIKSMFAEGKKALTIKRFKPGLKGEIISSVEYERISPQTEGDFSYREKRVSEEEWATLSIDPQGFPKNRVEPSGVQFDRLFTSPTVRANSQPTTARKSAP